MARAAALAIALATAAACGQPSPSPHTSPMPSTSAVSDRCTGSFDSSASPAYAFPTVEVPAGTSYCFTTGDTAKILPWQLTNDGPMVAFNARDAGHSRDLWIGDLSAGTVTLAYQAPEGQGRRAEIIDPQMRSGLLFWLEKLHVGADIRGSLESWAVMKMDLGTRKVETLDHGTNLGNGDRHVVLQVRYDGRRLALAEWTPDEKYQIEVVDLTTAARSSTTLQRTLFDYALVENGVVYTEGTNNDARQSMGQFHTSFWDGASVTREIGVQESQIAAEGRVLARIKDPEESDKSTGNPRNPRVVVGTCDSAEATPVSPIPDHNPTVAIGRVAAGSGTVAWWEAEWHPDYPVESVLTIWQPAWKSPVQVKTTGNGPQLSVSGGWVTWFEFDNDAFGRLRGVPLSVLTSQVK